MTIVCPHCQEEIIYPALDHINIDQTPEFRVKIQDLSCFRTECPNCGEKILVEQSCLYHDMQNRFMVWLWLENQPVPQIAFDATYTLRLTDSMNTFREKINLLESGLDDRVIELMKLLLYMQLNHDLDVVELLWHEIVAESGEIRFVAVLSDGAEQYISMPYTVYQRLYADVDRCLFTPSNQFLRIDMDWAAESLQMLRELSE